MAAKPIERYVKRQIQEQGGWPRILERLSSGETVADISRTLLKTPAGPCISRNFFSTLLHQDPERSAEVLRARREGASAMVDDALHIVDTAPVDRDSVNKAKVMADLRVKVAGFIDREHWGEQKQQVQVQVNLADVHLDSLRHRVIESELASPSSAVAASTEQTAVCHTRETTVSLPTSDSVSDSTDNGDYVKLEKRQ